MAVGGEFDRFKQVMKSNFFESNEKNDAEKIYT